jgi:hypothetical protein
MASGVLDTRNASTCAYNYNARWSKRGPNDWTGILESHSADWRILQSQPGVQQLDILVLERGIHSDAQGTWNLILLFVGKSLFERLGRAILKCLIHCRQRNEC